MTTNELRQCAVREVGMRERVYPSLVSTGKMSQTRMEHEIQAMQEIADLLSAKLESEEPRLL